MWAVTANGKFRPRSQAMYGMTPICARPLFVAPIDRGVTGPRCANCIRSLAQMAKPSGRIARQRELGTWRYRAILPVAAPSAFRSSILDRAMQSVEYLGPNVSAVFHCRKKLLTVSRTHGSTGADRSQRCAIRGVAKRVSRTLVGTACRRPGRPMCPQRSM